MKDFARITLGPLAAMAVIFVAVLMFPQAPPAPTPGQAPPVSLTDAEKTKQENLELKLQMLQRDQQDFLAAVVKAHNIDVSRYRYDENSRTFFPSTSPPAQASPRPAPVPPVKPTKK